MVFRGFSVYSMHVIVFRGISFLVCTLVCALINLIVILIKHPVGNHTFLFDKVEKPTALRNESVTEITWDIWMTSYSTQ